MAFSLENALTIEHLTQYDAKLKPYIDSANTKAFKHVDVKDNAIRFFADPAPAADASADYTVDLPTEYFLDQAQTRFVESFAWSEAVYPGSTDPALTGLPVLVLAVKGDDGSVIYSFLDVHALVDVTVPAGGGAGDILTKKSDADYDMEWTTPAEGIAVDADPTDGSDNAVSSGGVFAALAGKVDVAAGKQLSTEDYTTEEKEKLATLENYDDTDLSDRLTAIEDDYLTSADKTELQTETDTKISDRVGAIPDTTTIKEYVDTAVGTGGTDAATAIATAKQEAIDTAKTYTDEQAALKQDVLTGTAGQVVGFDADGKAVAQDAAAGTVIDAEPTQGSSNAVSSGGVYTALQGKQDTLTGTEGQFVGFDADGNVLAQEVPAVKPVEMTQAEYDQLTDEQKMDGTVRYIVDGVTKGAVPGGGTAGQVLGKLTDDDGDYGWVDQTGGTGAGLPAGGTTGQVLAKQSDADGDATWVDLSGTGGVTAPVNGFFTLAVEPDGNLYAYSADDGTTPVFEYDEATGDLYYLTEGA